MSLGRAAHPAHRRCSHRSPQLSTCAHTRPRAAPGQTLQPALGKDPRGIDIGVPEGTPVRAAAPGTVSFAGWLGGDGNVVTIDHGAGLSTAYLHLSAILVPAGKVAAGSQIGTSGCTGYCFGPHLHFELRIAGSPIDPLPVLIAAGTLAGTNPRHPARVRNG